MDEWERPCGKALETATEGKAGLNGREEITMLSSMKRISGEN